MTQTLADSDVAGRADSPRMRRAAEIGSLSYDEEAHTVDLVFSTGAPVRRRDWRTGDYYVETLDMSPAAVRLGRLNAGAPFLDTHDDSGLRSVIGSVVPGSARIEGGKGVARVQLSRADEHAGIVANIIAGVIRNVSIGYANHRIEVTENATGDDDWRVVDWEPYEISAVPIPADAGAQIRGADGNELATRRERTRATTISKLAEETGLRELGARAIETGASVQQFRATLLNALVEREAMPIDSHHSCHVGEEHHQKRARVVENVIAHRADNSIQLLPGAGEFRGMTLLDLARESLEANGIRTRGMTRHELAGTALAQRSGGMHSTSDFPIILGNVVNTTLRSGYEAAGQTFRPLVRQTTVPDFKEVSRTQLGEAPAFDKVNEHGEYKRGTMAEGSEKYKIATYGKIIAITRQAIINDDMNAFGRIPQSMGVQAAQLESDLVWYQILANPVMGDGTTLFHANHKNLQTGVALDVAPISLMRTAMAKQVGLDGKTVLNVVPSALIVPIALETKAEQLLRSVYFPQTAAGAATPSMKRLEIVSEARLDNGINNPAVGAAVSGSSTAFYLAASPGQIDTIELAYLEGREGVYIETRNGFDVDGLEVKVRLDVGAKVIDWRAFQRNPGAA